MVRKSVVSTIDAMEQKRDINGLLDALNNTKNPDVRHRTIDALGRIRSGKASHTFREILEKDKDEIARERAIIALGCLKDKRAWNPILEILKNSKEPENVRWASAEAISYYDDIRAVGPLLDALEYSRGKTLINVILSLGRLKDKRALEPLMMLFEKELAKKFDVDEDFLVLINTAIAFQNFDDSRAINPLFKALKLACSSIPNCEGRCGDLQREALNALGKIKDKRAFNVIVNTLESGSLSLKLNSVNVLKSIENRKVLAPLHRALRTNRDNKPLVERLLNAISEIETYAGKMCYFCGEDRETRAIRMIDRPVNRRICLDCWNDMKFEQKNPDTRMVIECGWDDDDHDAGASEKRLK